MKTTIISNPDKGTPIRNKEIKACPTRALKHVETINKITKRKTPPTENDIV